MKVHAPSKRTSARVTTLGLLALAALSGQSYGQLLKIGGSFAGRNAGDLTWDINTTAGVDAQADWNFLGAPFNFNDSGAGPFTSNTLRTDNGLIDSAGTSAVTVTVNANDSWNSDGGAGTADEKLMKGIIKAAFAPTPKIGTLTFNNLDATGYYKVIAYSAMNGAGSNSEWSLLGATTYSKYYITSENAFDGTYTRGTALTPETRTAEADYLQWNTVQPGADGKLNLQWTWTGGQDGAGLAGFQLVQLAVRQIFWNVAPGAGTWDDSTNTSFVDSANAGVVAGELDRVTFDNRGAAGARTVNVQAAGVTPLATIVDNDATHAYTIAGGPIRGGAGLSKSGVGTLTLSGANEFTGGVQIKHGTVNAATIGDATAAGNLGQGGAIALGDSAGANDAVLNYTGNTATYARTVTTSGNGGTLAVGAGQTLTLGSLTGDGQFTKGGAGNVVFTGADADFTGNISVPQANLTVARTGPSSGKTLSVGTSGAASFTYTGTTVADGRNLTVGTGGATITVSNPNARYQLANGTATAGNLTVSGAGRLAFSGPVSFTAMPTIQAGATLALQAETGNTLPTGPISVSTGTLVVGAPGTVGDTRSFSLSGGTLRLAHEGLQGNYYTGGLGDVQNDLSGTAQNVVSYFNGLTPAVTARTNTNSRVDLDFNNGNYGNGVPFSDQGQTDGDNVRAYFTGKILITAAGNHTFFTTSDDGSALFIDGQQVVSNNFFQGPVERSGTISLAPGLHDIQIYYYEGGGGAGLKVDYTPAGGARQVLPNSVLYANDIYNAPGSNITTTASSTLELGGGANLGTLTPANTTTLAINGSATFANTALAAGGTYGLNVTSPFGLVNLGPITGTGTRTINKSGAGALVFNQAPPPTGLAINVSGGLVVNQGTDTTNPLAGVTLNFVGGGLGLSSTSGNPNYSTPITIGADLRVEAGTFGTVASAPIQVTLAPTNGITVPAAKTLTLAATDRNYSLVVGTPVTGGGALVVEQGQVRFDTGDSSGTVINAPGGMTVKTSQLNVLGSVNAGPVAITNSLNGSTPSGALSASVNISGNLTSTSLAVSGGRFDLGGALNNSGALNHTGGVSTINGNVTTGSLALSGGSLTVNGTFASTGAAAISNNAQARLANGATLGSLALTGSSTLSVSGDLTVSGTTTINQGTTLNLDAGGITHYNGAINVNGGLVRATTGITDLGTNALTVAPRVFAPGLIEGLISNTGDISTAPNPGTGRAGTDTGGVRLAPRMGSTNQKGGINGGPNNYWDDNETWVYTGQFYDADGVFNFAESVDDRARVTIDGVTVLSNSNWQTATSTRAADGLVIVNGNDGGTDYTAGQVRTGVNAGQFASSFGMGPDNNGWHTIEIRFQNGGGGAGTVAGQGWGGGDNATYANKGFGLNVNGTDSLQGTDYVLPIDPGDGSLFRVVAAGTGGQITVEAGATIAAGSTSGAELLTLNGVAGSPAVFKLNNNTSAKQSSVDVVKLAGFTSAQGTLDIGTNNTLTVGKLAIADGTALEKIGTGTVVVSGSVVGTNGVAASEFGTGSLTISNGTVLFNSTGNGTGKAIVQNSGILGGTGTLPNVMAQLGGIIAPAPGNLSAVLNIGTSTTPGALELVAGGKLSIDLQSKTILDQLNVRGSVFLEGATLQGSLLSGFNATVNDLFFIILNDGTDAILNGSGTGPGTFQGLANNAVLTIGNQPFRISYFGDSASNAFTGGNDVVLMAIPEPSSVCALLVGVGSLMGAQRFRSRRTRRE